MSKCDVFFPPRVFDDLKLREAAYVEVQREFERMWPDECVGGDPTFIFHRGEGLQAPGTVSFWGTDDRRDAYITGYLRGVCRMLQFRQTIPWPEECAS